MRYLILFSTWGEMSMTACRCQKGQQSLQQRMQPVIGLLLIFRVLTAGHSDHLHMIIDQITEAGTANDLPAGAADSLSALR